MYTQHCSMQQTENAAKKKKKMPFNSLIARFISTEIYLMLMMKFASKCISLENNMNYNLKYFEFIMFHIFSQVGWVKADTKAIQAIHEHVITHNPRVTVSHSDLNTWNLHIKSVTEDDRGGYMCQVSISIKNQYIHSFNSTINLDFFFLFILCENFS